LQLILDFLGQAGVDALSATAARYSGLPRPSACPPQLKLYTYFSMFFMSTNFTKPIPHWSADSLAYEPVLVISVVTRAHALIELQQMVTLPIASGGSRSIQWGKSWYLQTPLDNVPENSSLILELRSSPDAHNYSLLGWSFHTLHHASVTTSIRPTLMQLHAAPHTPMPTVAELSALTARLRQDGEVGQDHFEVEVVCSRRP
jgi:hypothetical protein